MPPTPVDALPRPGRRWRWLTCLLILSLLPTQAAAQESVLRRTVEGDVRRPIQFLADDITTWTEDGIRIFLMQGRVTVAQNDLKVKMDEAVVWVDEEGQKKSGLYRIKVAGLKVALEESGKKQNAEQAVVDLSTRGDIALKAYVSKVTEKNLSESARYKTAFKMARGSVAAASPPAKKEVAKAPSLLPPLDTKPLKKDAAPPRDAGPIKLVQAVTPVPPDPLLSGEPTLPGTITPPLPPPGPPGAPVLPLPKRDGPMRALTIRPRSSLEIQSRNFALPSGETAWVITSGIILTVTSVEEKKVLLDIEADRLVFWTKGDSSEMLNKLKAPTGETSNSMEFYLSGNVEIRNQTTKEQQILRADEVYYDVGRSVAVALRADLEVWQPGLRHPVHLKADELHQLNPKLFVGTRSEVFSSGLPSDPGLKVEVREATLEERDVTKKTIFGVPFIDRATGQPQITKERIFTGSNMVIRAEGIPVFYFPFFRGNIADPLGPLENLGLTYNRIFGFQLMTTWNVFDLIGVDEPAGTRWDILLDYLSRRGPAVGTIFDNAGSNLFGIPNNYAIHTKAYGVYDQAYDILGGDRGRQIFINPTTSVPVTHPDLRGRWQTKMSVFDLPNGFSVKGQFAAISDRNFLEQYFPNEWLNDLNQGTFLYLKQQNNNWAWSVMGEPRLREWITETEWLPRGDAYLLGQKVFDLFTFDVHASAGYARLRPTEQPSPAYDVTDQATNTGRFDITPELSLPLHAGPFNLAPYINGSVTYYTRDLNGQETLRLIGGGGLRASMPMSRLYPEICSELFNLNGIYHKVLFHSNYYIAEASDPFNQFPQLDRLNDDASDQALRDIRPWQQKFNPQFGNFLTTSPIVDPQVYAIRRLIQDRIDTRDDINVLQLGVNQRWQTRRGLPGNQHVIDWMTLDLRASVFPQRNRDNFGEYLGVLEYDWVWNIGDRTALTSSGWFEPFANGPRVFNFGTHLGRPDSTNLYLGYRQIDPLESRAFIGSITYPFSAKYAVTGSTVYDFGVDQLSHNFVVTRIGTDLMVSFGVNYNSTLNTFGVQFEILPVLLHGRMRGGGIGAGGVAGLGR